ncbi:hypothetical protein ACELLULO517_23095 [Acidisoma cellulosilytica]|uniref:Uncharacterized protein n=1 Tax=Acidisoma cellulosilyticum TaxID=2802395 RepID=A0A964E626_9PROT|nr:hypothetical protein [Acidisoma cellulosilyticum]MCB8883154.1 hypothetical protein [Acidisoma cellulosilyticum]
MVSASRQGSQLSKEVSCRAYWLPKECPVSLIQVALQFLLPSRLRTKAAFGGDSVTIFCDEAKTAATAFLNAAKRNINTRQECDMADGIKQAWWQRLGIGGIGLLGLAACASNGPQWSPPSYWNTSAQQIINTTCRGIVYNGSQILGDPPSSLYGHCYFIHGPLEVSDWVTGTSALVNGNALKIDNVRSFSSNIVPGGLFLGDLPFPYQDLEGKWREIAHLRDLGVRLAD